MKTNKDKFVQGTFNLYTAEHIPDTHREFYKKQQENLPESTIKPTIPEHIRDEALVLYEAKEDTNYKGETTYYLETHPIIALISNNGTICQLRKDFQSGRYRFFAYQAHYRKAHYISHHKRSKVLDQLDEPNKIGVWSDKKVNDWLHYCDRYAMVMQELADEYEYLHTKNLKTVEEFIDSLPNCTVTRNDTKTYVDTDLFKVTFTHERGVEYLRQDIKFDGTIDDISAIEKFMN